MSDSNTESNKDLVRRFVEEVQCHHRIEAIEDFFAESWVNHDAPPGAPNDREGAKTFFRALFEAFPDTKATVEHQIAEGDCVVTRKVFRGTHTGAFMGMPPTGRTFEMKAIDVFRVRDGKITDHWGIADALSMMKQLGSGAEGAERRTESYDARTPRTPQTSRLRMLHTMIRVTDLERSLAFYTEVLGMKLLRRKDYPDGKFTLAFVGYGPESETAVIELTHNWETRAYELGNAFGHLAIQVEDAQRACESIAAKGGKVARPAAPMKHGSTVIAFVEDPDGYRIELIEKAF